jgi:hypothetical protein
VGARRLGLRGYFLMSIGGLASIGIPALTGGLGVTLTPDIVLFSAIAGVFSAVTIIGAPIAAIIL